MFISFEGIDGCGKSTQVRLLDSELRARGKEVIVLREPGATPLSESIRHVLLDSTYEIDPTAELLLFCASRRQLLSNVIAPALQRNVFVLCDRYADSSLAYQGYGRGLPLSDVHSANALATGGLEPHITFFIDISVEESFRRAALRENFHPDRMERAGADFFQRVRSGYREMAYNHPDRIALVDGETSIEAIHRLIVGRIDQYIASR